MANTSNKMPSGIPYIIGNEAAERYSFYGMKAILLIFLTTFIRNGAGELSTLNPEQAKFWVHLFIFGAYGVSILGALLSDIFLGKYKTIIYLSIVYCIGHFVLAVNETHMGFLIGCTLIAIGAGGIKPCVSSHVGDQFESHNSHLIEKMFFYFYLSINAGAVIAYATAEPILKNEYLISKGLNSALAFGLPGILMVIATVVFWMGRKHFISIKPAGWQLYKKELFSKKGRDLVLKLIPIYLFVAVFWSLFDQTASAWVVQADSDLMNKTINLGFTSFDFYPSQIGFFNPLLIVLMVPLFTAVLYPFLKKRIKLNYTRKMSIGMFLTAMSFALIAWVQAQMDAGVSMNISWQILGYVILTAGEIFVSVTILEFSYTQAPNSMKSFIMSFYLLSVAVGNLFTALVNLFIQNPDGTSKLAGASYFWFFTGFMLVATVLFVILIDRTYKEQTHIQDRSNAE